MYTAVGNFNFDAFLGFAAVGSVVFNFFNDIVSLHNGAKHYVFAIQMPG